MNLMNHISLAITRATQQSADTAPPTVVTASIPSGTNTRVDLLFSEPVNSTLGAAAKWVTASHTYTAITYVDSTHAFLTTSAAFTVGETVTLAYTSNGTADVKDLANNILVSFSGKSITNNLTGGITDTFNRSNGVLGTRSDGGSWTLINGIAPVISSNTLVAGAGAGCIVADLTYQNGTYNFDINSTVGTFTPIARFLSNGSATTEYVGLAINDDVSAFGLTLFSHTGGSFNAQASSGGVLSSGVTATITVVITGAPSAPSFTVKKNGGSALPGLGAVTAAAFNTIGGNSGATKDGLEMPASGVFFDNYSAV